MINPQLHLAFLPIKLDLIRSNLLPQPGHETFSANGLPGYLINMGGVIKKADSNGLELNSWARKESYYRAFQNPIPNQKCFEIWALIER